MTSESGQAKVELLGWGDGLLDRAASWLVETHGAGLGTVLVAVPGARAGHVLGEAIARRADPSAIPPKIVTAGLMTDEVLDFDGVVADRLVRTLVWERAIRELDPEVRLEPQ